MLVRSSELPKAKVVVDTVGDKTTVTLWDGQYSTVEDVQETSELGAPAESVYEYTIYLIDAVLRPTLQQSVEDNFDVWYAAAKSKEAAVQNLEVEQEIQRLFNDNLAETLLDLDFRVAMLEENNEGVVE